MVSAIKVDIKWPFVKMLADPKLLRPIRTSSWRKRIMFHGRQKRRFCVSGRKNSSKLAAAGFTFTGRKVILPAVCQCKVYCNDHFSGVDVRKAAGAPKENSSSGFQSSRGVVDLHKQIIKQND